MLTNAIVKAARPQSRAYKLSDEGGLQLHVAPSGTRAWRWRFRFGGTEQLLTLGRFPDIDVAAARAKRDAARTQLDRGEDPRGQISGKPESQKSLNSDFEGAARAWLAHMAPAWSDVHAGDVAASLERDVFPAIGALELGSISRPQILALLRAIEARGSIETARRVRQRISAVFEYAMSEGWCDEDPAAVVGRALKRPPEPEHHPALVDLAAARTLFAAIAADQDEAALRAQLLALTGVRTAAVRKLDAAEFEGLAGQTPLWRVPAARMKLKRAKKEAGGHDHLVPLGPRAAALARLLIDRGVERTLGEGALRDVHARHIEPGRHVPHGWRATFSTLLNDHLGETWSEAIDRALAHQTKGKVEAAYNRAEALDRRRAVFAAWEKLIA